MKNNKVFGNRVRFDGIVEKNSVKVVNVDGLSGYSSGLYSTPDDAPSVSSKSWWETLIGSLAGIGDSVANIWRATLGQPNNVIYGAPDPNDKKETSVTAWIIGGVAIVGVLFAIIYFAKKKS